MLALQFQLERGQWHSPQILLEAQRRQLALLLAHARATVPYYRELFSHHPTADYLSDAGWQTLPLLTRRDIQSSFDALNSERVPPPHGKAVKYQSSGSTGTPIRVLSTEVEHLFRSALMLRDHLWHQRDLAGKHAAIRTKIGAPGSSASGAEWGPATRGIFNTGPSVALDISTDVEAQLDWLVAENPDYLLTHPSNLRALAKLALQRGVKLPALKHARSFGETMTDEVRDVVRQAWNVGTADIYSAEEIGVIALQCPQHEQYHVQAENVLVEIVDAQGKVCVAGETGQVVITTLHNFAMPLLRYANGDWAEAGEPCACGRGLPVLKRVLGRTRNMLLLPDGKQHWPSFPSADWLAVAPIEQIQVVQTALEAIEVRYVMSRSLEAAEQTRLTEVFQRLLGYSFNMAFERVPHIVRGANMKYEDFICRVDVTNK